MPYSKLYFVALGALLCMPTYAVTMYDAALGTPVVPANNWTPFPTDSGSFTPPVNGGIGLDSTADITKPFSFGKFSPINLNRLTGYEATWEIQVTQEQHNPDMQRAGFSVIVIGSDLKGVEFGFWGNKVFVYNDDPMFTPGEGYATTTGDAMHLYRLIVTGSSYSLWIDGVARLGGALRNYSAFGPPYSFSNGVAVGDDTSRGSSLTYWKSFAVVATPEPSSIVGMAVGSAVLLRRRKKTV